MPEDQGRWQPCWLDFYMKPGLLPTSLIYVHQELPTTQILVTCSMAARGAGGGGWLVSRAGRGIFDAVDAGCEGGACRG
jgi:hypothetical protein